MYMPACENVTGVQMSANVPPPPLSTHRLGYCASQRYRAFGSPLCVLLYGFIRVPSALLVPWPPRKRTSSIRESFPAIHIAATARLFTPPVNNPIPITIVVPPCGASSMAFGDPTPSKPGVLSARSNCVVLG